MRGSGRVACSTWKPTAQSTRAAGSEPTIITSSPIVLMIARVVGERVLDVLDEALHRADRLLVALLLGQPRVAGEVGEGDRHAQPAEVERARRSSRSVSMWPITSCSTKCARKRWWTWSIIGEASGSSSRASPSISSAISRPGHAVAHERLVDVEVEQAHLGVGDLRQRLAVDADELQEGDQREARAEHAGDVAQELQVVLGDVLDARVGRPIAGVMRSISAGSRPVSRAASSSVCTRSSDGSSSWRIAEGQAALLAGLADLPQRVPALAQARDEPRVGDGGRRPARRRTAGSRPCRIQRRSVAGVDARALRRPRRS